MVVDAANAVRNSEEAAVLVARRKAIVTPSGIIFVSRYYRRSLHCYIYIALPITEIDQKPIMWRISDARLLPIIIVTLGVRFRSHRVHWPDPISREYVVDRYRFSLQGESRKQGRTGHWHGRRPRFSLLSLSSLGPSLRTDPLLRTFPLRECKCDATK